MKGCGRTVSMYMCLFNMYVHKYKVSSVSVKIVSVSNLYVFSVYINIDTNLIDA